MPVGRPFQKGQSGNPGGRRGHAAEMAKLIREQTRNGAELVEYALTVFRGASEKSADRQWAMEWLADRGFGKPQQAVDLTSGDEPIAQPIDLTRLTVEQLEALSAIEVAAAAEDEPQGDGGDEH